MSLDTLEFWVIQAMNYTQKRSESLEEADFVQSERSETRRGTEQANEKFAQQIEMSGCVVQSNNPRQNRK